MTSQGKKKPSAEVLRVAQELSFARALASNDPHLRDRALKRLKKWFSSMPEKKESFDEASFSRLWKGLYYCLWMSDKPLTQEDCVDRISGLVNSFKNFTDARKFVTNFFRCMSQTWFNLDAHRIDKYLMLVRRFLRQIFEMLYQRNWDLEMVKSVAEDLTAAFLAAPLGLNIHITEVYMEELAKVGRGKLSSDVLFELIKPFGEVMRKTDDARLLRSVVENIFFYLLRQTDEAMKHQAKFEAWKQVGFAGGNIEVMEEVSDEGENNDDDGEERGSDGSDIEGPYDPRAGNVDVFLPPLQFNCAGVVSYLTSVRNDPKVQPKSRKQLGVVIAKYQTYQSGKYPLGIHEVELVKPEDQNELVEKAAEKLAAIEEKLFIESDVEGMKMRTKKALSKSRNKTRKRKASVWETTPLEISETSSTAASPAAKGSWIVKEEDEVEAVNTNGFLQSNGRFCESIDDSCCTPNSDATESCGTPSSHKKKKRSNQTTESSWGNSTWESTPNEVEISLTPVNHSLLSNLDKSSSLLNGTSNTPSSSKKVEFVLNKNTSQEEKEYKQSVKKRPSIPFDALRKPTQGVLKSTPPVNSVRRINHSSPSLVKIS